MSYKLNSIVKEYNKNNQEITIKYVNGSIEINVYEHRNSFFKKLFNKIFQKRILKKKINFIDQHKDDNIITDLHNIFDYQNYAYSQFFENRQVRPNSEKIKEIFNIFINNFNNTGDRTIIDKEFKSIQDIISGYEDKIDILHCLVGMSEESGELLGEMKKNIFHNKPVNRTKLISESGDLFWYYLVGIKILNISLNEIIEYNIEKLNLRYPKGRLEIFKRDYEG